MTDFLMRVGKIAFALVVLPFIGAAMLAVKVWEIFDPPKRDPEG